MPPPSGEDVAMTTETIFKAYVDLANSERQAIWARNASMLVANSFMLSAIANLHPAWLRDWFAVAGLILCVAWYFLMKRGVDITRRPDA
jgi:hypothetical protein